MRKILGIVLTISLVLTSVIPALAAETESKGLEQAILKVKSVVTIPDDYKDFQYSSSQYEENGKLVSVWYLNWNKDDYSASISASVEDGGYLVNYNRYDNKQSEGLGNVTREAGQKTAAEFLAKVRPDIAADLRLQENTDNSNSASDRHYYQYKLYKNDIAVSYVEASVEVDKHTGEVLGYYFQGSGEELSNFPSSEGVIGLEAAKTAWLSKINVPLSYYSYYDSDKKLLTVFPAYSGSNTAGKAIDAKTGEAVPLYNSPVYYGGMGDAGMKNAAADSAVAGGLTPEETERVGKRIRPHFKGKSGKYHQELGTRDHFSHEGDKCVPSEGLCGKRQNINGKSALIKRTGPSTRKRVNWYPSASTPTRAAKAPLL